MKNMTYKSLIFLFLSQMASTSFADENNCSANIHQAMKNEINEDSLIAESCKVWPYKTNITIAVFAYPLNDKDPDEYSTKKVTIALIDNKKNHILNLYSKTTEEDAVEKIGSDSFKIDTARYQLSDNTRAFGIRFQTSERGPSCADYLFENRQTLYIPEKNTLHPVLDLYMHTAQALSGCIGSSTNKDIIEDSNLSILIEKNKSNNFYDLKVVSHIEPFTDMDNPPSNINMQPRIESYQYHYNGKKYVGNGKNAPWWINTLLE